MDSSDSTSIKFSLSVSADRDHFLRRSCASCGRDFKTRVNEADLQWALSLQVQRMGLEIGEQQDAEPRKTLHCPYCEYQSPEAEMHTEETVAYLKRVLYREYVLPMVNRSFADLEQSFGSQHRSSSFVSVRFEHNRAPLPVRPIHGPEPADLKIVEFVCCGSQAKISDAWTDLRVCIFCGTDVFLV
jgi:hypothetical protein